MKPESETITFAQRAAEKEASREADRRALAEGRITLEQLRQDNSMFSGPGTIAVGRPKRLY